MNPTPPGPQPIDDGLWLVDAHYTRPGHTGVWIVTGPGDALVFEAGTSLSTPRVLAALDALGVAREAVGEVVVSHVHLDHAGGAGSLLAALPRARLRVHPRGARHLVDPGRLVASATAVYGEAEMARRYGPIVPVAAHRVIEAVDGQRFRAAGRQWRVLDAPGHARHHLMLLDETRGDAYTGDVFGLSFPQWRGPQPWVLVTTTPTQFDPPAWRSTLDRLVEHRPQRCLLTHFGAVGGVAQLAEELRAQLLWHEERTVRLAPETGLEALTAELTTQYCSWLTDHGPDHPEALAVLPPEAALNAAGLLYRARHGG